jgi:hypothetical protein
LLEERLGFRDRDLVPGGQRHRHPVPKRARSMIPATPSTSKEIKTFTNPLSRRVRLIPLCDPLNL